MIPIMEHIQNQASHIARKKINIGLVENGFFFVLASIAGMSRQKFITMNNKEQYCNFFGVSMANSGAGKDTALKASENMFREYITSYPQLVLDDYIGLTKKLPNGEKPDEQEVIAPTNYSFALRGSVEGMMRAGNFYNNTNHGSLNVISTEFGAEYNPEVMPLLTALWQDSKADGSTNVNQKYPPIFDVPTNTLMFGSSSAFHKNQKKHEFLEEQIISGFGRRANFVWVDNEELVVVSNEDNSTDLQNYADQIVDILKLEKPLTFSQEAQLVLLEYENNLVKRYNKTRNDFDALKHSAIDKTQRMAALVALADISHTIEPNHVEYAIDMNERSFQSMEYILKPHAQYVEMFKILKHHDEGLSQTEFIDYGIRFRTKADWEFQKELLKDLAFRKNMKVKERGPKIMVKPFEMNDLNHMIVSTSVNKSLKPEMEINFKSQEVPFFGEGMTIQSLITSNAVQSFCLNHFEPSNKAPDGHRKKEYIVQGQNLISWDLDEGMTLEEAKIVLSEYTHIIYTTKSHQKNKNGITCDRFRILMPTKTTFYVGAEQHKQMYENLSEILNIPNYDIQTRNQGRLWYTNPEAMVYTNKGELLDVRCCIPETETAKNIIPKIHELESNIDDDEMTRRIIGMQKFVLMNGIQGARNSMLFRLAKFLKEIGGDMNIVSETNQMLSEPLPEHEVETILRNIR